MSVGMQLSVLCSEDAPRVTPADARAPDIAGTLFGTHLLGSQLEACAFWPQGHGRRAYYEPVDLRRAGAGAVGRARSGHAADLGRIGREAPLSRDAHHRARHGPRRDRTACGQSHRQRLHRTRHRRTASTPLRRRRQAAAVLPDARRARSRRDGRQHRPNDPDCRTLRKQFGSVTAVDGVSFAAETARSPACSARTAPARPRRCGCSTR